MSLRTAPLAEPTARSGCPADREEPSQPVVRFERWLECSVLPSLGGSEARVLCPPPRTRPAGRTPAPPPAALHPAPRAGRHRIAQRARPRHGSASASLGAWQLPPPVTGSRRPRAPPRRVTPHAPRGPSRPTPRVFIQPCGQRLAGEPRVRHGMRAACPRAPRGGRGRPGHHLSSPSLAAPSRLGLAFRRSAAAGRVRPPRLGGGACAPRLGGGASAPPGAPWLGGVPYLPRPLPRTPRLGGGACAPSGSGAAGLTFVRAVASEPLRLRF